MHDSTQKRSVLIIDGNSWTHRAFHAISTPLTAPNGQPTNAVFGFMSILIKTLHELRPDAVVAAFDAQPTSAHASARLKSTIKIRRTVLFFITSSPWVHAISDARFKTSRMQVACGDKRFYNTILFE